MKSFVLGLMTLTVVLVGLSVIAFVAFLPFVELALLSPSSHDSIFWIVLTFFIQVLHLRLLWVSTVYLNVFRTLVVPIRELVMPLAMVIVKIEAIREQTPILYLDLARIEPDDQLDEEERLLQYFRQSIRRRYKKMEEKFREKRIVLKSNRSETSLNLSQVVPIMWEHERRCCERDGKNVVEEFIKRFLVMVLTTHGVLDSYYDANGDLVCVQLSVQQSDVLHWFMYFSVDSRSGIWYHGVINAMARGLKTPSVRYINAQNHQTESKTSAGLRQSDCSDGDVTDDLYPWAFLRDLPDTCVESNLWG